MMLFHHYLSLSSFHLPLYLLFYLLSSILVFFSFLFPTFPLFVSSSALFLSFPSNMYVTLSICLTSLAIYFSQAQTLKSFLYFTFLLSLTHSSSFTLCLFLSLSRSLSLFLSLSLSLSLSLCLSLSLSFSLKKDVWKIEKDE